MATIPGLSQDRLAMQVDPAEQAERDRERLRILRSEEQDQRLPAEARAAVGREIGRMGAAPAAQAAPALPPESSTVPLTPPQLQEDPALLDLRRRYEAATAAAQPPDGLLGMLSQRIGDATQRRLADPLPQEEQSWDTMAAASALFGSGPVAGGLEFAGTATDIASGAAAPLASTGGSAGGMFALPSDDERRQEEEARQRMLKGPAFDTTQGNVLRAKANEIGPDPLTSHRSTQILHGLSAGLTKAVGSALLFGGVPGAVVFGAEEGNTVAQNLIVEGVDPETAAKVGAVTGVASALGAGLPVAGGTAAKTATLAAVGGPGTFVAQEVLSKKILAEAGYTAQAELHDPTDPVMLALSTVIPGAMGALSMRQAARAAARAKAMAPLRDAVQADAGAQALADAAGVARPDEVIIQDATAPRRVDVTKEELQSALRDEGGLQRLAERSANDPEAVDAARVRVLDDAEAKHIPPETPRGNEAGIDAVRAAVETGDMGPMRAMVAAQETAAPPAAAGWFSGAPAGLVELSPAKASPGNLYGPGVYLARDRAFADTYGRGADRTVYEVAFAPQRPFNTADIMPRAAAEAMLRDVGAKKADIARVLGAKPKVSGDSLYAAMADVLGGKDKANAALTQRGYDAILFKSRRGDELAVALKPVSTARPGAAVEAPAVAAAGPDPAAVAVAGDPRPAPGGTAAPAARIGDFGAVRSVDPATLASESATRDGALVADLAQQNPDMMVTLPGQTEPMRLADALEQVRAQAKEMREDGDLFKAAAECALMSGG